MNANTVHTPGLVRLYALGLCTALGMCSTALVNAADVEGMFDSPWLNDLVDGKFQLVEMDSHGTGVHMSLKSSSRESGAMYNSPVADLPRQEHGVHLTYRIPLK